MMHQRKKNGICEDHKNTMQTREVNDTFKELRGNNGKSINSKFVRWVLLLVERSEWDKKFPWAAALMTIMAIDKGPCKKRTNIEKSTYNYRLEATAWNVIYREYIIWKKKKQYGLYFWTKVKKKSETYVCKVLRSTYLKDS